MADKVKEVAVGEADRIKTLTIQAARSAAYLYPIKASCQILPAKYCDTLMFVCLQVRVTRVSTISSPIDLYGMAPLATTILAWQMLNSSLPRKPLTNKLAPTMTLGLGITTFMFVFTYLPQMAVMAFTSGPLAAVSAALLVLSESSTLFTVLSKTFLIEDALVDTFDGVLLSKNTTSLVSEGRQIKGGSDIMGKLGKLTKKPFQKFTPTAIIRYFMYLPLNFIPVVGTVMFVVLQGRRAGPAAHSRYFQLKQWNSTQRQKHVEEYKAAYTRWVTMRHQFRGSGMRKVC